ncbi:hypothetical protein M885DRAFT_515949 [Pelagophyceae sp. CCMP2097]|nr:hypothetical protein M885DRAFT_515949 [Pelagophyceae sp. CCMP2097]
MGPRLFRREGHAASASRAAWRPPHRNVPTRTQSLKAPWSLAAMCRGPHRPLDTGAPARLPSARLPCVPRKPLRRIRARDSGPGCPSHSDSRPVSLGSTPSLFPWNPMAWSGHFPTRAFSESTPRLASHPRLDTLVQRH